MNTATYLVTVDEPGNMTCKAENVHVILTSTDRIAPRDRVHVEAWQRNPDEYNGWANRETWAVALHLSNDQSLYQEALWRLVEHASTERPADSLRAWVEDEAEKVYHEPKEGSEWARMLLADAGSLWRVDWEAVAASFEEE